MFRRLFGVNALLVVLVAALAAWVGWEMTRPAPPHATPPPHRPASAAAPQPATGISSQTPSSPGSYGIIASRNLFSPTRSDAPAAAAGAAGPQVTKPNLYGIVLREGAPIAYLEDPVTKRVAGYRVGDAVAGGTLKSIDADRVVLARPEGSVDVRLHDPAKPRAAGPQAQPGASAGAAPAQPAPSAPGVVPPVTPPQAQFQPPGTLPGQPGPALPPAIAPGRRPVPPNLLRRFQQNAPGDASSR